MFSKNYCASYYSFLIHMLRGLRNAVLEGTAEEYSTKFFHNYYRDDPKGIP